MKNPLRRTLSFFLALALAFSPLTVAAEGYIEDAEEPEIREIEMEPEVEPEEAPDAEAMAATVASGTCGTNVKWSLDANGLLTISGSGKMDNYSETAIAPWTKYYRSNVTSIIISNGVKSIGNYAFYSCYNVESVAIPHGVTSIGDHAFGECVWLKSVDIPISVTSIGNQAFSGCFSLTTIEIPEGVTSIGQAAFASTGLTSITIPDSVASLGSSAFAGSENSSLRSAVIGKGITRIPEFSFDSCYLLSSVEITDSITEVCENAFAYCYGLTDVYFSGTKEQWNKIAIRSGNDSFSNASIHYNFIPGMIETGSGTCGENLTWSLNEDGVLTISGSGAMDDFHITSAPWNSLTKRIHSILIEDSITSIGNYAFTDCDNLTDVVFGKRIARIGDYAFCDCDGLTSIDFPSSITSFGEYAFYSCSGLTEIDLPHDVSSIGVGSFAGCANLNSISVAPVNYFYSSADGVLFNKGKTTLVQCPGGKSGTYSVPNGVLEIGEEAFAGCESLTSILLPNTLTAVCDGAFLHCTSLDSMIFPKEITRLGTELFVGSRKLSEIYFSGDAPAFSFFTFASIRATAYYPKDNETWTSSARKDYGGTITWKQYIPTGIVDDITTVDNLAFSQLVGENLQIGKTVYETLKSKWDSSVFADNPQITYSALYGRLANWKVVSVSDAWPDKRNDGFYAAAFQGMTQKGRRTVIAFRGSANPTAEGLLSDAVLNDWIENDIEFQAFHTYTPQLQDAASYYAYCMTFSSISQSHVTVTGHSLGGALSSMVSLVHGVQGETFNSASAFEALYIHAPLLAGKCFSGVDCWNSVCHIINGDKVSNWPWASDTKEFSYFPNKIYQYAGNNSGLVNKHLLGGFLRLVDGRVELTTPISVNLHPNREYYTEQSMVIPELYLGTSSPNRKTLSNNKPFTDNEGHFMYGGDGSDELNSVTKSNDLIVGGGGSDSLDGGKGDDTYYYFKGNGCQTIHDISGNDKIILVNFSSTDSFTHLSDATYSIVYCNGEPILKISKSRKQGNPIRIYDECSLQFTLTDFRWTGSMKSSQVECPTDVEILDSAGKVVQTLKNGENRTIYTDYGNFYVFPNEAGESIKYVDLLEGYSFRIRGVDNGTMNVMYCQDDGEVYHLADIPVTKGMTAAISEITAEGETPILIIDTDSDGRPDSLLPMSDTIINQPISIDQNYLVLNAGETTQLAVHSEPAELTGAVVWSVNTISSDEPVISVDANGLVTALNPGTAEVIASVTVGEQTYSARCRIDVVAGSGSTHPIADEVSVNGITLLDTKATVELYRTDYTRISVLLNLRQNMTAFAEDAAAENTGHAIQSAKFVNSTAARYFSLRVADDRTLEIVPTAEALANPASVPNISSAITLTVDGKTFTTQALTAAVKKTLPTVKVKAVKFNSFAPASAELSFSGADVIGVESVGSLPEGFRLNGLKLLYSGSLQKTTIKLNLLAKVRNLAAARPVTLSVSISRTEPTVKLSPASVTLMPGTVDTAKVEVRITPADFADRDVKLVLVDSTGYHSDAIECTYASGVITLKPKSGTPAGSTYKLHVSADGAEKKSILTIKTGSAKPAMTLKASGAIDAAIPNSTVTVTPKITGFHVGSGENYSVVITQSGTNSDVTRLFRIEKGEVLTISAPGTLPQGYTYTALVKADLNNDGRTDCEKTVKLPVKWSDPAKTVPTVTLKASGSIDVIRPDTAIRITPTVKNFFGFAPKTSDLVFFKDGTPLLGDVPFTVSVDSGAYVITSRGVSTGGKYSVGYSGVMNGRTVNSKPVSLSVKMGSVKLSLSETSVTLQRNDRFDRKTVRLLLPEGVTSVDLMAQDAASLAYYAAVYHDDGSFSITFKDHVPTAKAVTVKLGIFLKGNTTTKPNAILSLKVSSK